MSDRKAAGLFIQGTETRVPLTGVRIRVEGCGAAARVTVAQRYVNTEKKPIEAVYSFPLEESSAVCGFTVETGGRVIVGKIEEKEKAFEKYDNAIADGHGAFLVDQDRPNIFTASVGNLKPGQEATISLSYAAELEQHGDSVRVMIPTTISPRYIPQSQLKTIDPSELDHLTPPTVIGAVPYGLSFDLKYDAPQGVKSVSCPSHPAQVEIDGNTARVSLMGDKIQLDRDVVVNVTLARPHEAGAIVARDGDGTRAVMLNFYPDIATMGGARGPSEFVFIVDRSGSMQGESITQALNALRLALRSMDEGDRFNIVGFGSHTEKMYPEPVAYSQKTLDEATKKLESWDANLGGTELLQPLQLVLEQSGPATLPRQIMLLTDGQVGNEAQCIELAGKHAGTARLFTFGIGHGASEHLVRGLARASGGQAEFIQPNERIEPKVMRQFARAASPYLKNVRIDWGSLQTDLSSPEVLPPLFNGDRMTLYGRVIGGTAGSVAILADGPNGTIRVPLNVDLERVVDAPAVPVLMARRAIQELEEGRGGSRGSNQENRKQKTVQSRVLELALRYQLMSSQTSFVAIEERAAADKTTERAELRRVPVALTKGWGEEERERGISIGGAASFGAAPGGAALPPRMRAAARCFSAPMPPPADSGELDDLCVEGLASAPCPAPAPAKKATGMFAKAKEFFAGGSASFDANSTGKHEADRCESDGNDGLQELTCLQQADGHFVIANPERFGIDTGLWAQWLKTVTVFGGDLQVASTAAALALLDKAFADRRDEWRMIADKAERWLTKQKIDLPPNNWSIKDWARNVLGF